MLSCVMGYILELQSLIEMEKKIHIWLLSNKKMLEKEFVNKYNIEKYL